MSLSIALQTAASGLMAAQTGLRATSDNIANVNTPGYVRKSVDQRPMVVGGAGMGVQVEGLKRVTDQYLQVATISANSESTRWGTISQYLDNSQSLFGDPSGSSFYFTRLDDIWSSFSAAANDPSSSLMRSQAISTVQDFFAESGRVNAQINELRKTTDAQAKADVSRINDLLEQINSLNSDISRAKLSHSDSSGSENIQSGLIDELSGLMNIQVSQRTNGGVVIRAAEGYQLAGDAAARLSYNRTDATPGYVAIEPTTAGVGGPQPIEITSGDLRGLLDLRDITLPGLTDQLGEFVSRVAERINAAHNASVATPAPSRLKGRDTGLDLTSAASNFTGTATIAVLDSAGVVQKRVALDFTAGTLSVDGGPASAFSPANFLSDLNTALGPAATASFANGALQLDAGAGGLAIDEGTSAKAGRGFSHFFGLNDLVRSTGQITYDTGLTAGDGHGFDPVGSISFRMSLGNGKPIRDITVTMPPPGAMQDLLDALNNNTTGVGLYGAFNLDAKGKLAFTPANGVDVKLSVTDDQTQRGVGGPSLTGLFGLGVLERAPRAERLSVDQGQVSNPATLALGKLDLTVAAGAPAIRPGDGRGALLMAQAGDVATTFSAAGQLGAVNMTISRYASEFGGTIGRQAEAADTRKQSSASVSKEATARRQSVEGVNLDEELVRLTTYQQAFNASARMIQASKDLFDVLTGML